MKRKKEPRQQKVGNKNVPKAGHVSGFDNWKNILALAIILLISTIVYLSALKNDFAYDDKRYIIDNDLIKDFSWKGIKAIFNHFTSDNYAPISDLINAVQYRISGLNPVAFHFGSLFFHILNVALVFWFVKLLSGRWNIASLTALFFGIHPMQVESVAWASGGSNLFCAAFFLGSLIAYLFYLRQSQKKYLIISMSFFILSMLSKAVAVMLPIVLILIDFYKGRKITIKILLEKSPFLILALGLGILTLLLKSQAGGMSSIPYFTFLQRIAFASYGFITYLFKLVFPLHLSAFYPYPIKVNGDIPLPYYLYVLVFIGFAAIVIYSLRFSKKIFFGIGYFAITIFIVLQLLPVGGAIMADRYSYIPSIGIFYLAGEGLHLLWSKKLILISIILLAAYTVFFSVKTYARCGIWKNDMTLWNDVISQYKYAPLAYYGRGTAFKNENKYDKALDDFNKAIELNPDYFEVYNNRGNLFKIEKEYDKALEDFNKAIELNPNYPEAYNNRGVVFWIEKKYNEAIIDFNNAIELNPYFTEAYNNRGLVFKAQKKYEEAVVDFKKAIDLNPNFMEAYYNIGNASLEAQKYREAIINYSKAIELKTDLAEAYFGRGLAEYYSGEKDTACMDIKKASNLGYQPAASALLQICN